MKNKAMLWDGSQVCPTLSCRNAGGSQRMPDKNHFNAVVQWGGTESMIVRRLTPVECERLQGYPDGWTEPAGSDTQRYKQCGNSVAVPCVEFLMQGISEVLKDYEND